MTSPLSATLPNPTDIEPPYLRLLPVDHQQSNIRKSRKWLALVALFAALIVGSQVMTLTLFTKANSRVKTLETALSSTRTTNASLSARLATVANEKARAEDNRAAANASLSKVSSVDVVAAQVTSELLNCNQRLIALIGDAANGRPVSSGFSALKPLCDQASADYLAFAKASNALHS